MRAFLSITSAIFGITLCVGNEGSVGVWFVMAALLSGLFALIDACSRVRVPLPQDLISERVDHHYEHQHIHHNFNYSNIVEGNEVTHELKDGTVVTSRQVRRWQ